MEHRRVVARRRMVRRYREEPLAAEVLERIAGAMVSGPTAGHSQGISVVVVTDGATRRAIARIAGEDDYRRRDFDPWLSSAPAHVVICLEVERYRRRYAEPDKEASSLHIPWWWVDGGAALVLGALAAVDEGLAAGFLGGHRLSGLDALLGIPAGVEVLGLLTVGPPAPDRRSSSLARGRRDDTVRWERWGE